MEVALQKDGNHFDVIHLVRLNMLVRPSVQTLKHRFCLD